MSFKQRKSGAGSKMKISDSFEVTGLLTICIFYQNRENLKGV
jgi:hypothetical protein